MCEADVATSGTADLFLKASQLTRTRHSHQITALALSKLQYEAWESMTFLDDISFEYWKKNMIGKSPTFQHILEFEILYSCPQTEKLFKSMEALVQWFFTLDCQLCQVDPQRYEVSTSWC